MTLVSGLSFAETWTGKLVDAACAGKSQKSQADCSPTVATRSFAIELSDGKILKLDSNGNSKATEAIKDTTFKPESQVTVSGQLEGQTVKVESMNAR